jgi:glycosyltransferase involved in cell wall biosynthesis
MEGTTIPSNGRKVTISVCMIVKDELENLKKGLPTILPWADEVIVNDTGSTDGTLEFLKILKPIKVIQTTWENDFSYARNVAIGGATKDWIISMDADEYLTEENIKAMLDTKVQMASLTPEHCLGVTVQNLDKGLPLGQSYTNFRIFPNFKGIRYKGKIHEQFVSITDQLGYKYLTTDVIVTHTGYDGHDKLIAKAKRDLEIMPTDEHLLDTPYGYIEIGDALSVLGQISEARDKYLEAYNSPLSLKYAEAKYAGAQNAGRMSYLMRDYTNASNLFALAHRVKPDMQEPLFYLAKIAIDTNQLKEGKILLENLLKMPKVSSLTGTSHEHIVEMSIQLLKIVEAELSKELPTYSKLKAGLDRLSLSMKASKTANG